MHYRAEGRQEYTALAFVPGTRPFDLFDPDRKGRMKLYVKRVFITDDAELLPRYLRFMRGIVDSADLPLNVSREMIQESPILAAIRRGVTGRILGDLAKLADSDAEAYAKLWGNFGTVLKEGIYEEFERREQLLKLSRFKTTASAGEWRSLGDYVGALKDNQTAIYYIAGDDVARLEASPQLEGFRARGIEVLLLGDPVDSFWVANAPDFEGKPFKSVTQGAADLAAIPLVDASAEPDAGDQRRGRGLPFVREGNARRQRRRRPRLRAPGRERGLPGGAGDRSRPAVREAAGRRRPAGQRGQADPGDQPAPRSSSSRWPRLATTSRAFARMRRICCSTRRASSTASGRRMPRPSRSGLARVMSRGVGAKPASRSGRRSQGEGGMRSPSDRRN